jgi:hypothetical protein
MASMDRAKELQLDQARLELDAGEGESYRWSGRWRGRGRGTKAPRAAEIIVEQG